MAFKILTSRLSKANLWLLFICLVVVITIFAIDILNFKNLSNIRSSLDSLSKPRQSAIKLIKINEELLIAENQFRIFLSTGDSAAKQIAVQNARNVISDLEKLEVGEDSASIEELINSVNIKIALSRKLLELKNQTDSVNSKLTVEKVSKTTLNGIKLQKINTKLFLSYYVVDTLKEVKQKKSFLKRLGDALTNKDNGSVYKLKRGDSSKQSELSEEVSTRNKFNKLADSIHNYYQQKLEEQIKGTSSLKKDEQKLAETNLAIISQIHDILEKLIEKARAIDKERTVTAYNTGINARASIAKMSIISFFIILIIVSILIFAARRSVMYERDIIESKEKAEKLAQTKARFLSNMSHEIRSPLTAIIGFTEQLEMTEKDQNKQKQLGAIRSASDHLLNTVNDILDFSKLDAGKLLIQEENFNLLKEIEEVFFSCTVLAEKKKLAFTLQKQISDDVIVMGDAHRIGQVLYNLINNAIKFTNKGSVTVVANATREADKSIILKIDVIDTGVGIPKDQLDMIFDEFAQASTNKIDGRVAIKGTGLGLSISKMLMQLMGGDISVKSEVNKGSTFTIELPMEKAEAVTTKTVATKDYTDASVNFSNKKALLVEDNEINILLLSSLLKKYNMEFDVAQDGETGMELFKNNAYDIVLTDINIPKLTGDKLAQFIRAYHDASKNTLPIVALTASIFSDDMEYYQKSGINKVLMKPFKEHELRETLSQYLV